MPLLDLPLDALAGSLLAASAKGTILLLLALGGALVLRSGAAATRHAVWVTALAALLVLPLAAVVLPGWHVASVPLASHVTPPAVPAVEAYSPAAESPAVLLDETAPAAVLPPVSTYESTSLFRQAEAVVAGAAATARGYLRAALAWGFAYGWHLAGLVWLAGIVGLALRWGGALLGAARIVRDAEPVIESGWVAAAADAARAQGVRGAVRLLRSDRLAVPVAWALGRPAVVLPSDADTWDADRRRAVLSHEMAHVARHDGWTQLLAQAAVLVHWFNPLAWVAYGRVLEEREQACDDRALMRGARPSAYAQHLVDLARRYRPEPLAVLALSPMARPRGLEARVRAILDPSPRRSRAGRGTLAATAALALAVTLPLAAFQPAPAPPPMAPMPPPAPLAVTPPEAPAAPLSDWTWSGAVRPGATVEVFGTNGNVSATRASGARVEAAAERRQGRPARGRVQDVEIVVREHNGGVTICAVWPGQRGCEPGRGPSGSIRDNNVSVNFTLRIPDGVAIVARATNGNVRAEGLSAPVTVRTTNGNVSAETRSGDVEAHTTNGNVSARAGGVVRAGTTNGNVTATFGRADWTGDLRIATTNGNVSVTLPASPDLDLRARTGTGSIRTDFSVPVTRPGYTGARAEGRIGRGGRVLDLAAQNGNVRVVQAGARTGAAPAGAALHVAVTEADVLDAEAAHDLALLAAEASLGAVEAVDWGGIGGVVEEALKLSAEAVASVDWDGIRAEVAAGLAEARAELRLAREEQRLAGVEARLGKHSAAEEQALLEAERALREAERALRETERQLREVRP